MTVGCLIDTLSTCPPETDRLLRAVVEAVRGRVPPEDDGREQQQHPNEHHRGWRERERERAFLLLQSVGQK